MDGVTGVIPWLFLKRHHEAAICCEPCFRQSFCSNSWALVTFPTAHPHKSRKIRVCEIIMFWQRTAQRRSFFSDVTVQSESEQACCAAEPSLPHDICSYQALGTRATGAPRAQRPSCPPLCLFTVQSGAWHWSLLAASPASEKCPLWEPRSST